MIFFKGERDVPKSKETTERNQRVEYTIRILYDTHIHFYFFYSNTVTRVCQGYILV